MDGMLALRFLIPKNWAISLSRVRIGISWGIVQFLKGWGNNGSANLGPRIGEGKPDSLADRLGEQAARGFTRRMLPNTRNPRSMSTLVEA